MEPRPFSHGYMLYLMNRDTPRNAFNGATTFQSWIQAGIAGGGIRDGAPSMEPRPFSHGYLTALAAVRHARRPSMEPRPFSHGYDEKTKAEIHISGVLQWSHDLSVMDTLEVEAQGLSLLPILQWSHDLSVMDTTETPAGPAVEYRSFNGATTFQSWIRRLHLPNSVPSSTFNGATTFQSWIHARRYSVGSPV